jgi:hypothetical protein
VLLIFAMVENRIDDDDVAPRVVSFECPLNIVASTFAH